MQNQGDIEVIPLLEEHVRIDRRVVELSTTVLKIETSERVEPLSGELLSEAYVVERHPVGRFVDVSPEVRMEGESTIYPVVEEVLVKRLMLREEVRVTPSRTMTPFSEAVPLRRQDVSIERNDQASPPSQSFTTNPPE